MFIGSVTNWTSTVGTDIPFVTEINSNGNVTNNNGTLSINKNGYYDIDASINVSGATGTIIVSLYADGNQDATTYAQTTLTTDVTSANLSLTDAIKVIVAAYPNVATIGLRVNTANVTVNGKLRVEYVR